MSEEFCCLSAYRIAKIFFELTLFEFILKQKWFAKIKEGSSISVKLKKYFIKLTSLEYADKEGYHYQYDDKYVVNRVFSL